MKRLKTCHWASSASEDEGKKYQTMSLHYLTSWFLIIIIITIIAWLLESGGWDVSSAYARTYVLILVMSQKESNFARSFAKILQIGK